MEILHKDTKLQESSSTMSKPFWDQSKNSDDINTKLETTTISKTNTKPETPKNPKTNTIPEPNTNPEPNTSSPKSKPKPKPPAKEKISSAFSAENDEYFTPTTPGYHLYMRGFPLKEIQERVQIWQEHMKKRERFKRIRKLLIKNQNDREWYDRIGYKYDNMFIPDYDSYSD